MKLFTRRLFFIAAGVVLVLAAAYFIWHRYKYQIVRNAVSAKVLQETNGLYSISYDSLVFDELAGNASLKNIKIIPDTALAKSMAPGQMPDIMLAVNIRSIVLTGVKTAGTLLGKRIEGDSVIIDHPDITLYSMKPLEKKTKIETEADDLYKQILGNLQLLRVGFVYINKVQARGVDFFSKDKNFDFINGKLLLENVLVDSAHNLDTSRILFCRQAAITVDSFFSYNHNRRELLVRGVNFLGKQKELLFSEIYFDRFKDDSTAGTRLLDAKNLRLSGVNSNEIVKNKNIFVDSILCSDIHLYEFPLESLKTSRGSKITDTDTTGFRNVYGIYLRYLHFPKVTFVPLAGSQYDIGNIAIKVNEVHASQVMDVQTHPMDFTREAEVTVDHFSLRSKDAHYHFVFDQILLNSASQKLDIQSFDIRPSLSEKVFAGRFPYQKDRYEVSLSGISLIHIDMNGLIDKKILADELIIGNASAKIYRDLHKPLQKKSKVGNYPSQLLTSLQVPVNVAKATFQHADIVYRENEKVSDSVGVVSFPGTRLGITNITNIPEAIKKNNELLISFNSRISGFIPLSGNFRFSLGSENGAFRSSGHIGSFDASGLNRISVPMALIRLNSGTIHSIDFDFAGSNYAAHGDFVMKYDGLKLDVLRRDKNTKKMRSRGLATLAVNALVKDSNPGNGDLRKETVSYDRDMYKSFFNLMWKTIFTGIRQTVGIP